MGQEKRTKTIDFTITEKDEDKRLDVIISSRLKQRSRSQVAKIIRDKEVTVNGQIVDKPSYHVAEGDILQVRLTIPDSNQRVTPVAEAIPLEIMYEDEDIIAINKPAGMVVHPGVGVEKGTVVNALMHLDKVLKNVGSVDRAGLVHRLDKDTSGLLLIAKSNEALSYYAQLFEKRLITKEYHGIISGDGSSLESVGLEIAGYMRRVGDRKRFGLFPKPPGKFSQTNFTIKANFERAEKKYSLLQIFPKTGRTHQIRVHLKSIGSPLVGDIVYKGEKNAHLMLHAHSLSFRSRKGKKLRLVCDLPDYFKEFMKNEPVQ